MLGQNIVVSEENSNSDEEEKNFGDKESDMLLDIFKTLLKLTENTENDERIKYEFDKIKGDTGDSAFREFIYFNIIPMINKDSTVNLIDGINLLYYFKYSKSEVDKLIEFIENNYEIIKLLAKISCSENELEESTDSFNKSIKQEFINFKNQIPISLDELVALSKQHCELNQYACFLPNSPSIAAAWNTNQENWGKLCLAAITLSKKFTFNKAWDLYQWFGYARNHIATILDHNKERDSVNFGRLRVDSFDGMICEFTTDITNMPGSRYKDQYAECDRLLKEMEQTDSKYIKRMQVAIKDSNKIRHIDVTIIIDPETGTSLNKFYRTRYANYNCIRICHPPAVRTFTIFESYLEPLYQNLLLENDHNKIYFLLGKIAYYSAQIVALEGGSASVSDMFMRKLMLEKDILLQPYAGKLAWDLGAIFSFDPEKYAENYINLFVENKISCPTPF